MCYCATSEREREKQSSSLFFISFYCKVIVIFCVRSTDESRESNVVLCERIASFFFLCAGGKKKYEHPKQCNTARRCLFCDDGPNFLSLCRFESSHVFVETQLERERERAEETL